LSFTFSPLRFAEEFTSYVLNVLSEEQMLQAYSKAELK